MRGTPSRRPYRDRSFTMQAVCNFGERGLAVTLLRTILVFVIFVILTHLGLVYSGIDENLNDLTSGIYALGRYLEIPAQVVVNALPASTDQRQSIEESGLYFIGFAAIVLYFVLFLLLGLGRR
jgi:hypothetical protein